MRKPSPPVYCIGMDPDDYDWKHHRFIQTEDGGIAVPLDTDRKQIQQGEEQMATKPIAKKTTAAPAAKAATKAPLAGKVVAKTTEKPVVAKEKPVKEKVAKEPRETFAGEAIALMKEGKYTDEQIAEKLFDKFPNTPDAIGALRWHRWKYNSKAKKEGKPLIEAIGSKKPAPVEKKATAKTPAPAPAAKAVAKAPVAPVKKTIVKKA